MDQLLSSLESMAYFHALGYAFNQSKAIEDFNKKYPFLSQFFYHVHKDKMLVGWIESELKDFIKDLKEAPGN